LEYPDYDFFNDIFDEKCRRPYKLIKWWFLDACLSYSSRKLKSAQNGTSNAWGYGESEFRYAYSEYCDSFSFPIEQLMLEVVVMLAFGGRAELDVDKFHRDNIENILGEVNHEEIFADLPADERRDILNDLSLLGMSWATQLKER
jgi:hypothetical protein